MILPGSNLLQEVRDPLPLGALEPLRLKKLQDALAGTLVDDVALRQQHHVIEQLERLGGRLEQRSEHRGLRTEQKWSGEYYVVSMPQEKRKLLDVREGERRVSLYGQSSSRLR